jgi:hypothetical protein
MSKKHLNFKNRVFSCYCHVKCVRDLIGLMELTLFGMKVNLDLTRYGKKVKHSVQFSIGFKRF